MDKKIVEDNTIFLTVAGSRAYGTNTETSDWDYRGVCIVPDKSYYFGIGINRFEQMEGFDDDRVIYDIRKFMALAIDNNPNIIELLFMPEENILTRNDYWERLSAHKDKFLSKSSRYRFGGYAFAQLKRIKSHRSYLLNPPKKQPERSDFGLPERKLISSDHLGAYQWLVATLLKNSIDEMNFSETTTAELKEANWIGLIQSKISDMPVECHQTLKDLTGASDEFIDIMMREKAYINASNDWHAYQDWQKRRNQSRKELEKQFGFDVKHAMHLVRLLRMGMEILEQGKVIVRRPDKEELIAIRNGAWSYEQIVEYAELCEKKLNILYETSTLPKKPNAVFVDKLCVEIIEDYLKAY